MTRRPGLDRLLGRHPRDERGQAVSVFFVVIVIAILFVAGLVADGGQKVTAAARAEAAAAGAARAAGNAGATLSLGGESPAASAAAAARSYLAGQPGIEGSVSVRDGTVTVRTAASEPTVVVQLIGVRQVTAAGAATADVASSEDD